MSGNKKEASKSQPCPFCGKTSWCFHYTDAQPMWICNRLHDISNGQIVSGNDGEIYECKGETKGGALYFFRKSDCDRWREEHCNKKKGGRQDNVANVAIEELISQQKKLQREEENDKIIPLPNEKLNKIYRYLLSLLELSDPDRNYLYDEGFNDELIEYYSIRTLSGYEKEKEAIVNQLIKKFGDLTGVPGFFQKEGRWCIASFSGILFPLKDVYGNIYRLRIRLRKTTKGGKYRNFAMPNEENGCPSGNQCGFFAKYVKDYRIAFIIEGGKKAIITNAEYKYPVISLPGVNSFAKLKEPVNVEESEKKSILEYLKEKGTTLLVVAYDADKHHNDNVLHCEKQTIKMLKDDGFAIATAEWEEELGKGMDDLLVNGCTPYFVLR
jgi:hypothetical protein